jgi:hypothetical protein
MREAESRGLVWSGYGKISPVTVVKPYVIVFVLI